MNGSLSVVCILLATMSPTYVSHLPLQIRAEIVRILMEQKRWGIIKRPPEITTKHGQLKTDRKSKPEPILVDDLALMEVLSEVSS